MVRGAMVASLLAMAGMVTGHAPAADASAQTTAAIIPGIPPAPGKATIRGFVVQELGDIAFAQVLLRSSSGTLVGSTFSGAGGFTFANVNPGTYTVSLASGEDSESVTVAAGQVSEDIYLTIPQGGGGLGGLTD
jgi:hypothetical protein